MTVENWNRFVAVAGTGGGTQAWFTGGSDPGSISHRPVASTNRAVGLVPVDWSLAGVGVALVALIVVAFVLRRFAARSGTDERHPERDQPILTDRERVLRLLDGNGGRMKQSQIVESVEWSKAKVSRLLAELESDEEIIKLRLGRENLICRPGYEPKASRSPRADGAKPAEPTHEATDDALSDE